LRGLLALLHQMSTPGMRPVPREHYVFTTDGAAYIARSRTASSRRDELLRRLLLWKLEQEGVRTSSGSSGPFMVHTYNERRRHWPTPTLGAMLVQLDNGV
jgi:hypothetical protein